MPHARVDAAAIRVEATNDHVIDADQRGQHTHRRDQPKRCVTGDGEGKTDDVGFAGAPVAVENSGRALPFGVSGAINACRIAASLFAASYAAKSTIPGTHR